MIKKSRRPFRRDKIPSHILAKVDEIARLPPPASGLRFSKTKTFRGVHLKQAVMLLLDEQKSFYGHKEIIFKGFCAWVLNSQSYAASKDAIVLKTSRMVIAAENSGRFKKVARHIVHLMQHDDRYQPLFKCIYYPIGGLSAVVKAVSSAPKRAERRKAATKEIRYLVAIATVLDYHARNLKDKKYGKPNIQKASKLAGLVLDPAGGNSKERGNTIVHEYLKAHRRALAFLYAADRVMFIDNTTLLDRLLRGSLKYKDVSSTDEEGSSKFAEWFSYAEYFRETVLAPMPGSAKKHAIVKLGRPTAPPMRELSTDQIAKIEEVLREKAESQKRLQL